MSDYSKITNFLSKDSLALNDPAKYVKGSEIDAEYNAIAVAIATKADTASPTLVTPNIGAATGTSLALGGGTALTTTNRTGTGNLVLATAPTLTGLTVSGGNFVSRGISDTATATALTLSGSGANSVTIANSASNPTIGTSGGAIAFNPAGQGEALRVTTGGASTVNYLSISGATTGSRLTLLATGSDTNVGASWQTKGSGSHLFVTETGTSAQVEITHTASANRYITLTGSNGGNPTIGTSGGGLQLNGSGGTGLLIDSSGNVGLNTTAGFSAISKGLEIQDASVNVGLRVERTGTGASIGELFSADGIVRLNTVGAIPIGFGTDNTEQVRVTHTASANRYITLTGSNGGNPKIGVSAGQLTLGTGSALATSATEGYVCIPTCAGAPTGVPAGAGAGNLPLIYDTTNNKLYAYNGAWKATAALT